MGFVDLHNHSLPGLDDGAPDLETGLAMLRQLGEIGFSHVVVTPHQRAGMFMPTEAAIRAAFGQVSTALDAADVKLELELGAENMWDDVLYDRSQRAAIPAYQRTGAAFLFELPMGPLPARLLDQLFAWRSEGRLPVLAHPERYAPLWNAPNAIEELAQRCALVLDLGAVAGYHGAKRTKAARAMLASGVAHAVASDAHSVNDVQVAAEGITWLRKHMGDVAVARLLHENPQRILAGEHPDS